MSDLEHLLALQALDLAIDQGERRLDQLPERQASKQAADAVAAGRAEVQRLEQVLAVAEAQLAAAETAGREIDAKVERLEGQLRNVIAVREAEALQHQIATLRQERSDHDDRGLEELERAEVTSDELDRARAQVPALEQLAAEAAHDASEAAAAVTAELDELRARRDEQAAQIPTPLLQRYSSLRASHGGVAIARLTGSRCDGCHLDLSRSEVEEIRHVPEGEPAECPSCGRLLVV